MANEYDMGEKVETKGTGGDETMTGSPDTLISLNWLVGEIEGMKLKSLKDLDKVSDISKADAHNLALTALQERIRSNKE
jgi:hypothetical protein